MDLKTTFLNNVIEEEVYIEQPKGFETFNRESHVCRFKQALYGLKQAPRAWYTRIDSYFTRLGFTKSEADANIYHIVVEGKLLIIVLYVDDLILTDDETLVKSCKRIRDERPGAHALFPWYASMARRRGTICLSMKVCQQNTKEVPHREQQTHGDSSRKLEEKRCYFG